MVPLAATFGGICSVAYSLRFVHDVFFNGQPVNMPKPHPHEPPWMMKAPVALLAVVCVVVGLVPALTFGPMVHVAATAVLGACGGGLAETTPVAEPPAPDCAPTAEHVAAISIAEALRVTRESPSAYPQANVFTMGIGFQW